MRCHIAAYTRRVATAVHHWIRTNWLLLTAAVYVVAILLIQGMPLEGRLRIMGAGLQVLGVMSVAVGLRRAREVFDAAPAWDPLVRSTVAVLAALLSFRWRPASVVVTAGGASLSGSGDLGTSATVRPGKTAAVERHLELLWASIDELEQRHRELVSTVKKTERRLAASVSDEATARDEATKRLDAKLETLSVGGLYLEAVGLACLVVGLVVGSLSSDLAAFIQSL